MRYTQRLAIHPGRVLAREIDFLSISQKELADKAGVSGKLISNIINEKALISVGLASSLEDIVGSSSEFWLSLCSNYESILSSNKKIADAKSISNKYHQSIKNVYSELLKVKMVLNVKQTFEKILELQKFFGITNLDSLQRFTQIAFRQNSRMKIDSYSLAGWLRYGDKKAIEANIITEYSQTKLRNCLPEIKEEIIKNNSDSLKRVKEILAECGVILITTESFKNTYTNGASRWLSGKPLIQLSDRGKNDDIVWFTLFHEIGHILKHGKKNEFISFDHPDKKDGAEKEADLFASEQLIPSDIYTCFVDRYAKKPITRFDIEVFCDNNHISKSIMVGRLQHDKIIRFDTFNNYKKKIIMSNLNN